MHWKLRKCAVAVAVTMVGCSTPSTGPAPSTTTAEATVPHRADRSLRAALPARADTPTNSESTKTMKIRMTIDGKVATATLEDSPAARDFATLLPLTLTLKDYASTEKVSDLPRKLSTEGAPPGYDPSVGDIAYYAPWGNLAIFYRDFGYAKGLIKLGTIGSGIDALSASGPLETTIEKAEP